MTATGLVLILVMAGCGTGEDGDSRVTSPGAIASPATTEESEPTEQSGPTEGAEPTQEARDEPPTPKKEDHESPTIPELARIIKDPEAHVGESVVVYAEVQYGTAVEADSLLGHVSARNLLETYGYFPGPHHDALFTGNEDDFRNVMPTDVVKVWATVEGSASFVTEDRELTTIPVLAVNHIDVIFVGDDDL